jgi:hypothetical protein
MIVECNKCCKIVDVKDDVCKNSVSIRMISKRYFCVRNVENQNLLVSLSTTGMRLAKYQVLPEWFIEKYEDKVNWTWISAFQKLSESFIEKIV